MPDTPNLVEMTDEDLAQRRYDIGKEISELKRQDEALRAARDAVEQEFYRRFEERGSTATKTTTFTVSARVDDKYPDLVDREAFEAYVLSSGNLFLLQSRLSMSAVQEELAAGHTIPGVRVVRKVTLNQTKRPQPKSAIQDDD
jgi:hypothetical protein